MLSPKGGASVLDGEKKLLIEGSICIDGLTLEGEINVSKSLTLNEKVDVEYHIRDMTRIPNVLEFWQKMLCLIYLCCCS